jgi:hypothetical protein
MPRQQSAKNLTPRIKISNGKKNIGTILNLKGYDFIGIKNIFNT